MAKLKTPAAARRTQTKITGFTTTNPPKSASKPKTRPNGNILSYFKKAEVVDETLFIGGGVVVEDDEDDIYGTDDLRSGKNGSKEEEKRFNEIDEPVKRRRVSPSHDARDGGAAAVDDQGLVATPAVHPTTKGGNQQCRQQSAANKNNNKKKRNPFLDDSSEGEGSGDDVDGEEKRGTTTVPNTNGHHNHKLTAAAVEGLAFRGFLPPLLRQQTSGMGNRRDEGHGEEQGQDEFADVDLDHFTDEDYDHAFTGGEEFREMRYMREQARLEAQEDNSYEQYLDEEDSLMEESCPICNGSLAGVGESQATEHVNACLDGKPTSLPKSSATRPPPDEEQKDVVDAPGIGKRFAKAALPWPGQAIPFNLGGSSSEAGGGGSGSAFTKLMSSHAEDAAWATAAAAEHSSRGKQAYKRTCPFYKIMPGMSICVDAFRYGAIEGCKAYFLSHFHSDHYIGLTANWTHGPIYCSKVTGSLVKSNLKTAAKYVVELEFDDKVAVPDTNGVFVTMVPANHCPGSSLFLFEKTVGQKTQRILHCGDFRACPAHIAHPVLRPNLFDSVSGTIRQQKIDVCYLDTTYLNPRYSFPPQDDVIRACAELCVALNDGLLTDDEERWNSLLRSREGGAPVGLDSVSKYFVSAETGRKNAPSEQPPGRRNKKNIDHDDNDTPSNAFSAIQNNKHTPKNRLLVVCGTYSIGKERICKAIAQALKTKIFASPAKIRICQQLNDPELAALMTSDPREAQVHMQMLMEIRAETLAEYLELHSASGGFSRIVGFRPSGWNYRPGSSSLSIPSTGPAAAAADKFCGGAVSGKSTVSANLAPASVPSPHLLHGNGWRTRFSPHDLVPQRGSNKEAMCFGVPYSEHSSFRELALFLMALRIDKVVPTVNVGSEQSRRRMKGWTDRWLAERRRGGVVNVLIEDEAVIDPKGGEEKKEVVLWEGKDGRGGGVYW